MVEYKKENKKIEEVTNTFRKSLRRYRPTYEILH